MNADQQQPEQFEARSPLARLRGSAGRLTASKGPLRTRWNALRQRPFIAAAFVLSLLAAFYWYVVASDRYLSEAHVVVQQTDLAMAPTTDLVSLLTGDSSGDRADQLMMREYLMSRDVVKKLDAELDLQGHYSSWSIDPLSRLNFANSDGDLYRYFLSRVTVEYDEYPGVLVVSAQAYTPEMAQRITQRMIEEGEAFMNSTAHNLASNACARRTSCGPFLSEPRTAGLARGAGRDDHGAHRPARITAQPASGPDRFAKRIPRRRPSGPGRVASPAGGGRSANR